MNGRRIYHARGKVLGGSSSINGMIFQRGNPMDYERWAGDAGMETWDYLHCLPYFKRMETLLVDGQRRADTWRGGSGPLVLERGPATNPLFGAFFEAAQQAGYPLTDDVNGYRQEGFARFDRNVHRGRRLSAARAYLHPVMDRPNLRVETLAMATKVTFDGTRATGVEYLRGGKAHRSVNAGEVILCGGAINTPQLLQLSGVGRAEHLEPLGVRMVARARRRRREPPGPPRGLHPVRLQAAGLDRARHGLAPPPGHRLPVALPPQRPRRDQPLRGRRLRAQQRRRRLAEPDVPLPPHRRAVRRHGAHRGPRLPGAHRPDVRRHPRLGAHRQHRPQEAPEDAVQLPDHPQRPPRVGRGGPGRARHPQPARVRAVQRRRALARTLGRDRRGDPRVGPPGRRDRAAPLVHGQDGHRRQLGHRPDLDAGARPRGPPRGRRQRLPLRHQRQHLRPRDDGRREGRRPDPGQHPARGGGASRSTATATTHRSTHPATAATSRSTSDHRRCGHDRNPVQRHRDQRHGTAPSPPCASRACGRSSAPRARRSSRARTPSSRARSSRRRPATWSASATSASRSPPARSSS